MDLFLRILLIILLFFVPFSFAGAEPWAFSIFQGGVCVLLAGTLFFRRSLSLTPLFKPVLYTLGILTLYTLIQCVATQTLLMDPAPYPATLMRLYSLEHASYFVTYLAWVFVVMQLVTTSQAGTRAVLWTGVCAAAIAFCALCLPSGEYIHALVGVRGGYGPFFNRNHGGIFLAGSTVLCLGWWCAARPSARIAASGGKKAFWVRQVWGLLAVLWLGVAAVWSRSRGGMLSLSVGLFWFAVCCAGLIPKTWAKRCLGWVLVLSLFGAGTYWACAHLDEINRFAQRRTVQDTSIETRKMLYRAARNILKDYPVWGIGVGAMPVVITTYVEKPIHAYVERLHSDWLEMLLGLGYAGGALVLAGIGWFLGLAWRRLLQLETVKKIKMTALLGTLLVVCTGALADFPFFIPATAMLFFWALGLACSPSFWKGHIREWRPSGWLRILLVLLCAAACFIPLQKTRAWRLFVFGRNLKMEAREQYYRRGLSYYPSPHYALRLGNAYYNASLHTKDPAEKDRLRNLAYQTAVEYLKKYPKDKELSILYMRSRPRTTKPTR